MFCVAVASDMRSSCHDAIREDARRFFFRDVVAVVVALFAFFCENVILVQFNDLNYQLMFCAREGADL